MIQFGDKINKLTVIGERLVHKKNTYRKCLCECGGQKFFRETLLESRAAQDCGCNYKKSHHPLTTAEEFRVDNGLNRRLRSIQKHMHCIGQQFNHWTVLSINEDYGQSRLRCMVRCVCGTVRETALYPVLLGQSKSCGCGVRPRRSAQANQKKSICLDDDGWYLEAKRLAREKRERFALLKEIGL